MLTEFWVRVILRWTHIILGLVIMCYVYSPFGANLYFQAMMKFFIIPAITLTGLWVWKFKAFNKFFRIR